MLNWSTLSYAAAFVIGSVPAFAAEQFITLSIAGQRVASWDQSVPADVLAYRIGAFSEVAVTNFEQVLPGDPNLFPPQNVTSVTYNNPDSDLAGGVSAGYYFFSSETIYDGPESAPVFPNGLIDNGDVLTISAIPEPSTWAMTLVGMGMIGFAVRRRAKIAVSYA